MNYVRKNIGVIVFVIIIIIATVVLNRQNNRLIDDYAQDTETIAN